MIKAVVKRYKTCKYKTYNMYRFVFDTDNSLELECGHNGKKGNHYGKTGVNLMASIPTANSAATTPTTILVSIKSLLNIGFDI